MIRRGKTDGWLSADHASLLPWACFHGATTNGINVKPVQGKGMAVFATASRAILEMEPLMQIPLHLVLSKENVELHAKSDAYLRDVLYALGDFGRTARGCILVFLLLQATRCCPDLDRKIGVESPLVEYIKYLPMELLPTFWTNEELDLLQGTSLAPAIDAKVKALYHEFENLRTATSDLPWCREIWWDEIDGLVTFDDWKQVDAFYRSRALELPGVGDCMVPCVDMCNHASGDATSASYESGECALLVLRDQTANQELGEITITYGDEKGACEMIFSYGFIEDNMESARDIFIDLQMAADDPLGPAKKAASSAAPGVRLFDGSSGLGWESDFVWLVLINEEDGLQIELTELVDNSQELQLFWKGSILRDLSQLKTLLQSEAMWNLYQLRAVYLIQRRIETQLERLYSTDELVEESAASDTIRRGPKALALQLRNLEADMLEQFYQYFEAEVGFSMLILLPLWNQSMLTLKQTLRLSETEEVRNYLANREATEQDQHVEDFS